MGELRIFRVVMVAGFLLFTLKAVDLATGGNAFLPKAEASDAQKSDAAHADAPAPAKDDHAAAPASGDHAASPAEGASEQKDAAAPATDDTPENLSRAEIDLLQNLSARRAELDKRARELDMREKLLEAGEKRVNERIVELKGIESNIQALLGTRDQAEEEKLASLVKVYESMKPKDAARIFEQLDMEVLLPVANRMKEGKIAAVLAQMAPEAAQRLTVNMAHHADAMKDATPGATGVPAAGKAG